MSELSVGTRVLNYEITGELGRGGMGVVYKATEVTLHRDVALKVLAPHRTGKSEFLARFLQEARAIAQLNHPNVVTIYQIGEYKGSPFIAMEFLKGQELDRLISERGRLQPAEALSVARQIASALGAAHELGIIHRDIKPHNVMVDPRGHVKVMDFGVAKLGKAMSNVVTTEGQLLGTPSYMAPEQFEFDEVDGRADLYSLGVVLYLCLTGRVPFDGDSPVAVMYRVLNESPSRLGDEFPPGVADLVERALAKNPNARIQTAESFQQAIDAIQDDPAAEAGPAVGASVPERNQATMLLDRRELADAESTTQGFSFSRLGRKFWELPASVRIGVGTGALLLGVVLMASAFRGGGEAASPASQTTVAVLQPVSRADEEPVAKPRVEITPESMARAIGLYSGSAGYVDHAQARTILGEFAQAGDPLGKMWLAWMQAGGRCGFSANPEEGRQRAAKVIDEVRRLAEEEDNTDARFLLGAALVEGLGVKPEPPAGFTSVMQAAEDAHAVAMNSLGSMYQEGVGAPKNAGFALLWFQRAAAAGSVDAMNHLGEIYLVNQDVKRADELAFNWFQRAADMGSPLGMARLARMYEEGRGVQPDRAEAVRWYTEARRLGDEEAGKALQRLASGA